ncbi:MAG: hypothetical protein ACHQJ6_05020 [Candidatus Berkiellales bacterium]
MKGFLYFIGICAAIGVLLSIFISALPVFQVATKGLLLSIQHKQYQQAYAMFSPEFKKRYDFPTFITLMDRSGLQEYKEFQVFANELDKEKTHGYISGVVITKQNDRIPIRLLFIKKAGSGMINNEWSIADIQIGPGAIETTPRAQ